MKYSIFTVMSPVYDFQGIASALRANGYNGVEWRVGKAAPSVLPSPMPTRDRLYWEYNRCTLDMNNIERDAALAKAACDKNGLECYMLSSYLPTSEYEQIERLMATARSVGAKAVRLFPSRYDPSLDYVALFGQAQKDIKIVEQLAKQYGVLAVLEQHMGTIIPSASAAYRLVENMNPQWIGIVFDAGNMVYEGYEQYMLGMQLLGKYVHHVHIKDAKVVNGVASFTPIGQGDVRFEKLLEAVKYIGYDKYLSFEDFSIESSDAEKLKNNITYIKGLVG